MWQRVKHYINVLWELKICHICKPHFGQQITVQYLTPVNQELLYQFGTNFFAIYGQGSNMESPVGIKIFHTFNFLTASYQFITL